MNNKIVTGNDLAKVLHFKSYRIMLKMKSKEPIVRTVIKGWTGETINSRPVYASINTGRWIAECECGGAEIVEPSDPIFFCFSCGNACVEHAARPVIFPENMDELEHLLLKRPGKTNGVNVIERAFNSVPAFGRLGRDWSVGETVEMLELQNKGLG